jgi:PAS domain-containing protein
MFVRVLVIVALAVLIVFIPKGNFSFLLTGLLILTSLSLLLTKKTDGEMKSSQNQISPWEELKKKYPELPDTTEELIAQLTNASGVIQKSQSESNWLSEFNMFINSQEHLEDLFKGYFSRAAQISSAHFGIILLKPEILYSKSEHLLIAGSYGIQHQFLSEHPFDGISEQAIKTEDEIFLHTVPVSFFPIASGLGQKSPNQLWVLPLKAYGQTLGLIELAFFTEPGSLTKELIRQSIDLLAVRVQNVLLRIRSEELLEESKIHTLALEENQLVLKESFKELQKKEDELEVFNRQIQAHQSMLTSILNEIPMKVFIKKQDGSFYAINKAVSDFHHMSVEELIGKSDYDLYEHDLAKQWHEAELEIIRTGKKEFITDDNGKFLYTIKMPFFIAPINETGLLGYQLDVSEIDKITRKFGKGK